MSASSPPEEVILPPPRRVGKVIAPMSRSRFDDRGIRIEE
jgi:hypothetical protein